MSCPLWAPSLATHSLPYHTDWGGGILGISGTWVGLSSLILGLSVFTYILGISDTDTWVICLHIHCLTYTLVLTGWLIFLVWPIWLTDSLTDLLRYLDLVLTDWLVSYISCWFIDWLTDLLTLTYKLILLVFTDLYHIFLVLPVWLNHLLMVHWLTDWLIGILTCIFVLTDWLTYVYYWLVSFVLTDWLMFILLLISCLLIDLLCMTD